MGIRSKRSAKASTALVTATVPVPVTIEGTIVSETPPAATIGDNSNFNVLPSKEEVHNRFAETMRKWSDADQAGDMQCIDASLRIMQRHEIEVAANTTGTPLPTLASLAPVPNNNAMFADYVRNLTDEFAGKYIPKAEHKGRVSDDANANRAKVEARMRRALRFTANLAYLKVTREAYDYDKRGWKMSPSSFLAPGWTCPMLTHRQDGENFVPAPYVIMTADSRHANYTASNTAGRTDLVSLSQAQINYVVPLLIAAKTGNKQENSEATPGAAKRKARQTVAEPATPNGTPAAEHTDENPPEGSQHRDFYVAQLNKLLTDIGKFLPLPALTPVKYADFSLGAWNTLVELAMIEGRIKTTELQGVDTGKVPAKRAASK